MNALEYLYGVPAMFINVESSEEKRQQFMRSTAPLFDTVYRLPAAEILDVASEAYAWRSMIRDTRANHDPAGYFENVKVFLAQDKTMEREAKQREYAATYSLYRSVQAALHFFLEGTDWSRMILLEDDAVPRLQQLSQMGFPPPDGDLLVWGGAISMGAHNHDDKLFLQGKTPKWSLIKNPQNRYIATAYEMTRAGAAAQLAALRDHPHAVDCSWWYTMAAVRSYALSPVGFVQYGQSDRINKLKEGKFER